MLLPYAYFQYCVQPTDVLTQNCLASNEKIMFALHTLPTEQFSMFCCTLLYVHSSIAIILMEKRELVALLLSSWCLVMVEWLFLAVSWGCLRFVIVVFPDHTYFTIFVASFIYMYQRQYKEYFCLSSLLIFAQTDQ